MKLSAMVYSFSRALREGQMKLEDVVRFLKEECEVSGVEATQSDVDGMGRGAFRKLLDHHGSTLACMIVHADFVHRCAAEQSPSLDVVKSAIDSCVGLGCRVMLVTTGGCKPGIDQAEARKLIAGALGQAVPLAVSAGVALTIEDVGVPSAPYGTSEHLLEMCALVGPDLKLTYDNGNFLTRGEEGLSALPRIWDRVVHVHFKDWREVPLESTLGFVGADGRRYVGEVVGEGLVNTQGIHAEIKNRGYDGYLSFEYEGPDDSMESARRGLANLRKLI